MPTAQFEPSYRLSRQLVRTRRGYLHVLSAGERGRPVVLLPILPIGTLVFEACVPLLADRGYAPIVIDLMGYGRSDKRNAEWSIADFADNLEEVLVTLEIAPIRVVSGHFTSLVATELAGRAGAGVEALVLDGPSLVPVQYAERIAKTKRPAPSTNDREFGARQWDHVVGMYRKLDPTFQVDATNEAIFRHAFLAMGKADVPPSVAGAFRTYDVSAVLQQIAARLLVIGSEFDTQRDFYQATLDLMPKAQGVFLDGVHPLHDLARPERAAEYVDILDRFFASS